ncbi:MAG TPA: WYL domain-containing protein [Streptosporangiaceae bacterium]
MTVTRDERLLIIAAELRAAAPAPLRARALAERLAVSERTVQRDIAALARSGLPVRRDDSGGYAVRPAGRPGGDVAHVAVADGDVVRALTEAVRGRHVVRIAYIDQAGERTMREVEAHGLVLAPYGDYLIGWCRLREAARQFRVDRIVAASLTGEAAGRRDLDDLIAALRAPAPRAPAGGRTAGSPDRARAWTLDRIGRVRLRLAEVAAEAVPAHGQQAGRQQAGRRRAVIGHLAEWTRWQVAALRAVATGRDMEFDGRRPAFPREFDQTAGYAARERMIQDAMAPRRFDDLVADLDEVLAGAARWAAGCPRELWADPVPEPGLPGRSRPLADLLAGWWSPLSHVEWHLDRLTADGGEGDEGVPDECDRGLVTQCPLRT